MRRRILTAMVAVTALAVVLFAIPLAIALGDLHREEEFVRMERAAAEAAAEIPATFPRGGDHIELPRSGHPLIGLYDRNRVRVAGSGPRHGDAIVAAGLRGDVTDLETNGRLVASLPVTRSERVVGALRVSVPRSIVTDRTRSAVLLMALLGAAAVGISAGIAVWQSRRLARPVADLADVAARLGDGDFTVQAEATTIPEVDAVSQALERTAGRLDQILTRERRFSEDASHQLRTPVTSLRVTLEAARLDPRADRDVAIDAALVEVDRLEQTIDDLLSLARTESSIRPETEVDQLLRRVEADWKGRLAREQRTIEVSFTRGLANVAVSDRAIRQILDVLVDNARLHGAGTITVRARAASPGVVVEVADQGAGVAGDPERVFERRVSSSGGTGIGLALARSLAEAEGGRLFLRESGP
ncbi:MAG: ATP-binding protein, partial [Acidimicrobiia bacterium]